MFEEEQEEHVSRARVSPRSPGGIGNGHRSSLTGRRSDGSDDSPTAARRRHTTGSPRLSAPAASSPSLKKEAKVTVRNTQGDWDPCTISLRGFRLQIQWADGTERQVELDGAKLSRHREEIEVTFDDQPAESSVVLRIEDEKKAMMWYRSLFDAMQDKKTQREAEERRAAQRRSQKEQQAAMAPAPVAAVRDFSPQREKVAAIAYAQIEARSPKSPPTASPVSLSAKASLSEAPAAVSSTAQGQEATIKFSPKHVRHAGETDATATLLGNAPEAETSMLLQQQSTNNSSNAVAVPDNVTKSEDNDCCKSCTIA